jgi:2-polyprenyl-3-methyl-5-hydroxy-6-metoxy-1,4-benzoquinol methylase
MAEHSDLARCPICGGDSLVKAATVSYTVHALDEKIAIDFATCRCGFVFQRNPLQWQSIKTYYENSPRYRSTTDDSWDRVLCRNQLAFFEQAGPLRGARVLDIGADMGKMLDLLQASYGCTTAYTEVNDVALRHLRSHGRHEEWNPARNGSRFDWIILSEVLEHIVDPVPYLAGLCAHLEEGGRIFIEVPNHSYWDSLDYGFSFEHVNYFSSASLAAALHRSGCIVTKLEVGSDARYYQGKVRIIRAVAQVAPPSNREDLAGAIRAHHRREMGDRFVAAQEIARHWVRDGRPGLALYGAAELADLVLSNTDLGSETVAGIYDGDEAKTGRLFHGFPVRAPRSILADSVPAVLILSSAERTIRDGLEKLGYRGEIIDWSGIQNYQCQSSG